MKKRILMLPSWYPTKDDPIAGSFFKEQAEALAERYDFAVARVSIKSATFQHLLRRRRDGDPRFEEQQGPIPVISCTIYCGRLERIVRFCERNSYWRSGRIAAALGPLERHYDRRRGRAYAGLCAKLQAERDFIPDLVYAMTAQANGYDAYLLGKWLHKPVVLAEHNPFPFPGTIIPDRTKAALESCKAVLAVSSHLSRMILTQGVDCRPIVVGNMIDGQKFGLPAKELRVGRPFRILIVGAYSFFKDYDTFFRAMEKLRSLTSRELEISIVGYDFSKGYSKGERAFMEHMSRYKLVPFATRDEMAAHYRCADAFVSTSIQETFGLSCVEAMACGVPVFATKSGGVEDFIDDTCGRLYDLRDSDSLAAGLLAYAEGSISFDPLAIRERACSLYGKEAFVKRVSRIFDSAIDPVRPLLPAGEGKGL